MTTKGRRPLIVKPTFLKVVAWVDIIFFFFCAVMAWRAGQGEVSPCFLLFVALGAYLLLFSGSVVTDSQAITYRTLVARYQIKWDEITCIEIDQQGGNIACIGESKQLAAVGPRDWSGKDKIEMLTLLNTEIEERGIDIQVTPRAMFRLSKNRKVRY